ncbi:MAG: hypothetical protein AAGI10_10480 [Pseudomonadota bacterium]
MPAYNRLFDLSIDDLQLIETALYREKAELSHERIEALRSEDEVGELDDRIREIAALLGRLHNQKVFYRPKQEVYVGG